MVHIDGSFLEGGGQILRTLHADRKPLPGAEDPAKPPSPRSQTAASERPKASIGTGGARARGARVGAGEIEFVPGNLRPGDYYLDIGTAGSVTLLMQALLPPCMFAAGEVILFACGNK